MSRETYTKSLRCHYKLARGGPYLMLTRQYRSHPEISDFVSKEFCDGWLVDDALVFNCLIHTK